MSYNVLYIAISVSFLVLLLVFLYLFKKGKIRQTGVDYRALFIMGISFIPVGIAVGNSSFIVLGIIYMAFGLTHKGEWKKNRRKWSELDESQKKFTIALISVLGILALLGVAAYFSVSK